jgi:hypothetical protein
MTTTTDQTYTTATSVDIAPMVELAPDPWGEPLTLVDALADKPPIEYIVGEIFSLPSVNVVFGDSGAFKSMWLADMAVSVAAGLTHLDPPGADGQGMKTRQSPVMWIDFDQGRRRTGDRLAAMARARGVQGAPVWYYSMPDPWLDGSSMESMQSLAGRMLTYGIGFLVVDNLSTINGGIDENSAAMGQVFKGFRWLSEVTGAVVTLVHHPNKPNGTTRKIGDTMRGSTAIKGAIDLSLLVEREAGSEFITVKPAKERDNTILPFGARFVFEHKPGTNELYTARFWREDLPDPKAEASAELRASILAALEDGPLNRTQIRDAAKRNAAEVNRMLEFLVQTRVVELDEQGRSKVYSMK